MKYAFISYSSKDFDIAKELYKYFKEHNIGVWMAPFDIESGSSYGEVIPTALKNSSAIILLLTKNTLDSKWCKKEVSRGISFDKPIFPLSLEPINLDDEFGFYLTNCQIKIINKTKEGTSEFKEFLNRLKDYVPFDETDESKFAVSEEDFEFLKNLALDFNVDDKFLISDISRKYCLGFRRSAEYVELLLKLSFLKKNDLFYVVDEKMEDLKNLNYDQFLKIYFNEISKNN